MFKKVFLLFVIAAPFISHAQLGGLLNKVKNKVSQRADEKVDNAIDKSLDKAEGKKSKSNSSGNETSADNTVKATSEEKTDASVQNFSRYDFIPGEKVLYMQDFAQEAVGELPADWNTNGSGEVVSLDKYPGKWLRVHAPFIYLTSNNKALGDNYTAEFDVILQLKSNGWMYPDFTCGFLATNGQSGTDNYFLNAYNKFASIEAIVQPAENDNSRVSMKSYKDSRTYYESENKNYGALQNYYGKPVHISIQVQKQRFRMWMNETKLFDAPKGLDTSYQLNQMFFKVSSTNYKDDQYAVYVSNLKLATGLPDTRHKLLEEGKFSTTGILFDVNSAVIKPESNGVIKEIATVLKDNPTVKIKITGHTSSDGDDNANLELSRKRAAAVKDKLVNDFQIESASIETDGKGETQPVADNKTAEGKAQNRRVEFVKL